MASRSTSLDIDFFGRVTRDWLAPVCGQTPGHARTADHLTVASSSSAVGVLARRGSAPASV